MGTKDYSDGIKACKSLSEVTKFKKEWTTKKKQSDNANATNKTK